MNFFESQEKARKKTGTLVMLFILAIVLIILAVDLVIVASWIAANANNPNNFTFTFNGETTHLIDNGKLNFPAITFLTIMVGIIVTPITLIIILLGTLFKMFELRKGGASVAKMVNATLIETNTTNLQEKRLMNVVEEMAIASGMVVPKLYIMKQEKGINAFVAGFKPSDTIMVVTQGALDNLSRDELQGVIGHEFSHIFNGDMSINLRLMGILGGILFIGQAGMFFLRSMGTSQDSDNRSSGKSGGLPLLIFGLGLFLVGYIGLFFGRLIKAAISRQRESLADACSVQYTRNPESLIAALLRIQNENNNTHLQSRHAEDISHLCFAESIPILLQRLLATHPPIEERIKALDPSGIYTPTIRTRLNEPSKDKNAVEARNKDFLMKSVLLGGMLATSTPNQIQQSVGNPNEASLEYARNFLANIPEQLSHMIHDPKEVELVFYALFTPQTSNGQAQANQILADEIVASDLNQVNALQIAFASLGSSIALPLLDISLPAFKARPQVERENTYARLTQLAALSPNSLHMFALLAVISKSVPNEAPPTKVKHEEFAPVITDVSALLSRVIAYGHHDAMDAADCYDRIMKNFSKKSIPQSVVSEFDPVQFQFVLGRLNQLSPLCKEILIKACLVCIQEDQKISIDEAEIVRAIAAYLGCPIPPITGT